MLTSISYLPLENDFWGFKAHITLRIMCIRDANSLYLMRVLTLRLLAKNIYLQNLWEETEVLMLHRGKWCTSWRSKEYSFSPDDIYKFKNFWSIYWSHSCQLYDVTVVLLLEDNVIFLELKKVIRISVE